MRGARDVAALRDWLLRVWRASGREDGWTPMALRALPDAALWYVPADTIDLASAAAETLPDNVVLDHHLTPPGACFIYCETSLLDGADIDAVLVHPVAGAGDSPPGLVLTGVSLCNDHQAKVGNATWALAVAGRTRPRSPRRVLRVSPPTPNASVRPRRSGAASSPLCGCWPTSPTSSTSATSPPPEPKPGAPNERARVTPRSGW